MRAFSFRERSQDAVDCYCPNRSFREFPFKINRTFYKSIGRIRPGDHSVDRTIRRCFDTRKRLVIAVIPVKNDNVVSSMQM